MRTRAVASALSAFTVVGVIAGAARAEEPERPLPASDARSVERERAEQRYQLNLGLGLQGASVGSAGGLGGLGGLGAPYAKAGVELRISGPVWLIVEAHGGVSTSEDPGMSATSWSAGAALGVRLEQPVFDFVSVGGYGALIGDVAGASLEAALADGTAIAGDTSALAVGAAFGGGLHFRASSFFGVRLGLELLRGGYARSYDSSTDRVSSSGYAELRASPSVALTFTF